MADADKALEYLRRYARQLHWPRIGECADVLQKEISRLENALDEAETRFEMIANNVTDPERVAQESYFGRREIERVFETRSDGTVVEDLGESHRGQ